MAHRFSQFMLLATVVNFPSTRRINWYGGPRQEPWVHFKTRGPISKHDCDTQTTNLEVEKVSEREKIV